jgi:hypothetical protein
MHRRKGWEGRPKTQTKWVHVRALVCQEYFSGEIPISQLMTRGIDQQLIKKNKKCMTQLEFVTVMATSLLQYTEQSIVQPPCVQEVV